jgi:hypothetical protein
LPASRNGLSDVRYREAVVAEPKTELGLLMRALTRWTIMVLVGFALVSALSVYFGR